MFQSLFNRFSKKPAPTTESTLSPELAAKVKSIQVLDLKKGQVLVVHVHESIPPEQIYQFQHALQHMIPNNPVVVCDEKFEFLKVTTEEFNAMKTSKPGQA